VQKTTTPNNLQEAIDGDGEQNDVHGGRMRYADIARPRPQDDRIGSRLSL
jgi:hypothetical protein